jgi:hypothetical protein
MQMIPLRSSCTAERLQLEIIVKALVKQGICKQLNVFQQF